MSAESIAHVTGVTNGKGGVGKTSVSFTLAMGLSGMGYRVLGIDIDPQGNFTQAIYGDELPDGVMTSFGGRSTAGVANSYWMFEEVEDDAYVVPLEVSETLHFIGTSKSLAAVSNRDLNAVYAFKEHVEHLKGNYDFVIIDCLPSMGILQTSAHAAADTIIIPTHLEQFSLKGIEEQAQAIKQVQQRMNPNVSIVGILPNEVSPTKIIVERTLRESLDETYGKKVFGVEIHSATAVQQALAFGKSILEYAPASKVAGQYKAFINEYLTRIGVKQK